MAAVAASITDSTVGKVFVKNLDRSVDNKCLFDTFYVFGTIKSCKVAVDQEGVGRGYGSVRFEIEEAAQKAVQEGNGMNLAGKKLIVAKFLSRAERTVEASDSFTNVFIKNLGEDVDDEKLRAIFEKFGEIRSCVVMRNAANRSKGFGFVAFKNPEDAQKAVTVMHLNTADGSERPLFVCRAQKKREREEELKKNYEQHEIEAQEFRGMNVYVKNFDDSVDDEGLKNIFGSFGNITSAKVMTFDNGRSKGFGFVCFENADNANRALNVMNFKMVGSKPLYVSIAQRKEDRRAQIASRYMQRVASERMHIQLPGAPLYAPVHNGYYVTDAAQSGFVHGNGFGAPAMVMAQHGHHEVAVEQQIQPEALSRRTPDYVPSQQVFQGHIVPSPNQVAHGVPHFQQPFMAQHVAEGPSGYESYNVPPQHYYQGPVIPTGYRYPPVAVPQAVAQIDQSVYYPIVPAAHGSQVMNKQWIPQQPIALQMNSSGGQEKWTSQNMVQTHNKDQEAVSALPQPANFPPQPFLLI